MLLPYTAITYYGPACGALVDTAPSGEVSLGIKGTARLAEQVQIAPPAPMLKATRLVNSPLYVQGTGGLEKALPKARARLLLDVSIGAKPSAFDVAQAVWGMENGIETGWTPRQILRVMAAVLAGKTTIVDGVPVTVAFRSVDDSRTTLTAEMDGSERTSLSVNA